MICFVLFVFEDDDMMKVVVIRCSSLFVFDESGKFFGVIVFVCCLNDVILYCVMDIFGYDLFRRRFR